MTTAFAICPEACGMFLHTGGQHHLNPENAVIRSGWWFAVLNCMNNCEHHLNHVEVLCDDDGSRLLS
jgi:hypothetical protein